MRNIKVVHQHDSMQCHVDECQYVQKSIIEGLFVSLLQFLMINVFLL